MLTFYFNIRIETKFFTSGQYIELLTFDRIYIYGQHQQSKIKHMHHITKINKITSAANQNNRRN